MNIEELFSGYDARPAYGKIGAEPLSHHIQEVSELAEEYASKFNMRLLGRQVGLLHDLGKRTRKFQDVLHKKDSHIDHSSSGVLAMKGVYTNKRIDNIIGDCVRGHHTKLNHILVDSYTPEVTSTYKVSVTDEELKELARIAKELKVEGIDEKSFFGTRGNTKMFLERMLFSALIDADWTASASWYNKDYDTNTTGKRKSWDELISNLESYRNNIVARGNSNAPINILRNEVYSDCAKKGITNEGVNTLTAPTGLGKTLALLKFALENARKFHKDRIIIALPYLSIIDQNAKIYKEICGDDIVFEVDSQVDFNSLPDGSRLREMVERWNAQIVVTTSVKLFDTMTANTPKTLRGLHNFSNSVIVFDECQTLPSNLIETSIGEINALADYCNATVLFSSATLPSYQFRKNVKWEPKELISNVESLYERYNEIKRTKVEWDTNTVYNYSTLMNKFEGRSQILFVFNTVKRAEEFYQYIISTGKVKDEEVYVLTSRMCSEHKLKTIEVIKERLDNNLPVITISTQCIEAGVDLDFPCGARVFAPFDSIVQTAGRINRNGKREGYMLVFNLDKSESRFEYPDIPYFNSSNISRNLTFKDNQANLNDLKVMEKYYNNLYHSSGSDCDRTELVEAIKAYDFNEVSRFGHLIEETNQVNIIVPYNKERFAEIEKDLMDTPKGRVITRATIKKSAPCVVRLFATNKSFSQANQYGERLFMKCGDEVEETNYYLLNSDTDYSEKTGLHFMEPNLVIL